jgi:predicted dithiol-disulfide oxidoreductase (DUF899 family)
MSAQTLVPAKQLSQANQFHHPNETTEYRAARNALLAEEIELRRHIERVAAQRRALPPGGEIAENFELVTESGPGHSSDLFGDKETLMVYSMMYGRQRKEPCPMCTSFLNSWNGIAVNLLARVAIAVTARSPIERLLEYKQHRRFANLPFVSDLSGDYTRTYSGEMSGAMADPGQDPRGAPDLDPLWLMLDLTPEGRGTNWHPKLDYGRK